MISESRRLPIKVVAKLTDTDKGSTHVILYERFTPIFFPDVQTVLSERDFGP